MISGTSIQKISRQGRPIRLAWFSPDCTHHSKARGKSADKVSGSTEKPGPGLGCSSMGEKKPGRESSCLRTSRNSGHGARFLKTGKWTSDRKGETFDIWIQALRNLGYKVEWRELHACDYGAPTIRKRLFVIARRDNLPIVWPKPTHGTHADLKPYRTAAECIDWATPIYSIFLSKEQGREVGVKRPLVEATMRRIGRGVWKYVINAEKAVRCSSRRRSRVCLRLTSCPATERMAIKNHAPVRSKCLTRQSFRPAMVHLWSLHSWHSTTPV